MKRLQSIDVFRGLDIILMILFNYSVTLGFFNIINFPKNFLYSFVFPRTIAGIFIILSTIVAYASYISKKKGCTKRYLLRGSRLLVFAGLITIFTYLFIPSGTVTFGILHFFAVTSFILPFIIKYKKMNLFLGILISVVGLYLQFQQFDSSYFFWLGFIPKNLFTLDYFPLLPWLGILMLGVYFSKQMIKKMYKIKFNNRLADVLSFFGRNSLTIYLIHQPILVIILFALGFRLVF